MGQYREIPIVSISKFSISRDIVRSEGLHSANATAKLWSIDDILTIFYYRK